MIRQVVNASLAGSRHAAFRRKDSVIGHRLFSAATSREKRALNQRQLGGEEGSVSKSSAGTPPPGTSSSSTGSSVPLLVVGLAAVGAGVAYSQGFIPGIAPHPDEVAAKQTNEPAPSVDEPRSSKAEAISDATGNRVVEISLPNGSKGSTPPIVVVGHPVGGNKVEMNPVLKTQSIDQTPSVDSALKELQSQLSQDTSRVLSQEHYELAKLSSLDMSELDNMSPTQLKIRLVQLAKDLEERTKWEAVRLKEFLAMKEKEVEDK